MESNIQPSLRTAGQILWDYHAVYDVLESSDLILGLGSHDIGVADRSVELLRAKLAPQIIFTGANAPTTIDIFPQGEAHAYRERAISLGADPSHIRVEPRASNTAENFQFTKDLVEQDREAIESVIVVCRPYQQRRARATGAMVWPEVRILCTAQELSFDDYLAEMQDNSRILNMLVGDTQRIWVYAERGFSVPQDIPDEVHQAYDVLVTAGYTARLVEEWPSKPHQNFSQGPGVRRTGGDASEASPTRPLA